MVSFWPWKGDDNSPASFEKTLSTLSAKISKTSTRLDSIRQRSRRLSVLWTLYAGFAYLLYSIILVLVVGWRKWGPVEYVAVAAGPVLIYLVRCGLSAYYDYRTSSVQRQLDALQAQRDVTITRLKTATKYDSTQELLKKYGGTPTPKAKTAGDSEKKGAAKSGGAETPKVGRTGLGPPPTANLPKRDSLNPMQDTPRRPTTQPRSPLGQEPSYSPARASPPSQRPLSPQEEFAPNAFLSPPQYAQIDDGSKWYDRIMDVLLGEDETSPRARIALICRNCRLVNGQAPPGVKRLEDVGKWRCGGCGTMNGEESEAKKIVTRIKEQASAEAESTESPVQGGEDASSDPVAGVIDEDYKSDITQYSSESAAEDAKLQGTKEKGPRAVEETGPTTRQRRSTRSTKGGKKAG